MMFKKDGVQGGSTRMEYMDGLKGCTLQGWSTRMEYKDGVLGGVQE